MARPTNDAKKHYIGVRLTDIEYESLGENKSEAIRELIHKGFVKQKDDSFVKQNKNNVKQNPKSNTLSDDSLESLADIEQMLKCSGGSLESFLSDLDLKLTWQTVKLKDGVLDMQAMESDDELSQEMDNLKKACEEKGKSLTETIRKAAQSVWNIRL